MADPVLAFVERECASPANRFGTEFLPEHLLLVEAFALQLASRLRADREVVRLAALLHDTAAIRDYRCVPVHAETGAELVEQLCGPRGSFGDVVRLDEARISRLAQCVREHSSPRHVGETIPESVCVSNADAMSQIARPLYWFHYARTVKQLSYADALAWYRSLVEASWSGLVEYARTIVARQHDALAVLLA